MLESFTVHKTDKNQTRLKIVRKGKLEPSPLVRFSGKMGSSIQEPYGSLF